SAVTGGIKAVAAAASADLAVEEETVISGTEVALAVLIFLRAV
ncbi:MAG: hypothetical protein ACD_52C00151G0001, partial [uncultured bacterium]